ncbi:MAG: DUF115 domain-containing protein, partial [Bacteroidia bacterium]|nr:DUF115 domain-containing protein [Bacteroidia bacterium]
NNYKTIQSERKEFLNLLYRGSVPHILFYDNRDPIVSIRNYLKPFLEKESRFFILLGMGLGYFATELISKKQLARLIIVEKDISCLKKAMESIDLIELIQNPAVKIVAGCPEIDLFVTVREAIDPHYTGGKDIIFIPLPGAVALSKSYYARIVSTVRDVIQNFMDERGNDPYDTLAGYEQFFININDYFQNPGGAYVKDFFKDKPAIVAATGPSLKKNIHLLKEVENSAVILSADASLRILHEYDIFPHFVTTAERPPGFDKHYRNLKNLEKTVFATASFVHPTTLKAYYGPKIFFNRLYDFMEKLGFMQDCISIGPTTANMAFDVARHMGCNPIILMGNDLCFDKSGQTHAEGFLYGEKFSYYEEKDRFTVPGNYEETVTTCEDWFNCIKAYEKSISGWSGTLINATAGGAKIRGSKIISLQEVIRSYCVSSFYPREMLLNHLSQWRNTRNIDSIRNTLNSFLETAERFIEISKKMRLILGEMVEKIEQSNGKLPLALIRQIDESIPHIIATLDALRASPLAVNFGEYIYTDLMPLLMEWQVINDRFSSPIWADAYRIKLADNFFASLGQLCISLKEVLTDGKKRLASLSIKSES